MTLSALNQELLDFRATSLRAIQESAGMEGNSYSIIIL